MGDSDYWIEGSANTVILLAHGAGAPADSGFMNELSGALVSQELSVWRFEFDYMRRRRETGRRQPPPRMERLLAELRDQVLAANERVGPGCRLLVAGKSMGGRVASLLAAEADADRLAAAAICFGYPFHPPAKPDRWRTGHLAAARIPVCILQGTRDPFGKPAEVRQQPPLGPKVELNWIEGGNHDFQPLKSQGLAQRDLIRDAARLAAEFSQRNLR
ncbi:alpha/beta family hydrolase [Marinobacter salicampi]|uniref:alpha/beta family hydrolase n=1 Tax=Marinobacter salicampi TaxID=435907 RepID=UPI001F5F01C3|nr:alpha/beta family hydrolase [Marinobacter salicampi]